MISLNVVTSSYMPPASGLRNGFLKVCYVKGLNTIPMIFNEKGNIEKYEGESISNQPNLFPVEIHLFFFDVIAL